MDAVYEMAAAAAYVEWSAGTARPAGAQLAMVFNCLSLSLSLTHSHVMQPPVTKAWQG